jgi:hypothetical protein
MSGGTGEILGMVAAKLSRETTIKDVAKQFQGAGPINIAPVSPFGLLYPYRNSKAQSMKVRKSAHASTSKHEPVSSSRQGKFVANLIGRPIFK